MNRFSPIDPGALKMISLVTIPDTEALIATRMAEVKARWTFYDPPMGAQYDVEGLEFDPIKICMEAGAAAELNALSRINNVAKATTLAWAQGPDLDALATRYPNGVPRLQVGVDVSGNPVMETDAAYRNRIWLSSNDFSTGGSAAAYVFQALTAVPALRDATAIVKRDSYEKEPQVVVTILQDADPKLDPSETDFAAIMARVTSPALATGDQTLAVLQRLQDRGIGTLTDIIVVQPANILAINYSVRLWTFPGTETATAVANVQLALAQLAEKQKYLGYSHTLMAINAQCAQYGVANIKIDSPLADVICDETEVAIVYNINVTAPSSSPFVPNQIDIAGLLGSTEPSDTMIATGTVS